MLTKSYASLFYTLNQFFLWVSGWKSRRTVGPTTSDQKSFKSVQKQQYMLLKVKLDALKAGMDGAVHEQRSAGRGNPTHEMNIVKSRLKGPLKR